MCNFRAPYFSLNRTKKEPVNEIQCHSLSSSPRRPVSLENLEMENSQGRFNRRAVSFTDALSMINSVQYQFCAVAVNRAHIYKSCTVLHWARTSEHYSSLCLFILLVNVMHGISLRFQQQCNKVIS